MIKACIFDLDGVIVDTAKYHYIAWKEIANELGFDFTPQDNERLKGVSRMTSLNILLDIGGVELTEEEKQKIAEKKNNHYLTYILKMNPDEILPGAKELLIDLKVNGFKIGLGSASKNAQLILDRLKLTTYFDTIVDGTVISKAKPDPEVFIAGAIMLGVDPEECIVFEDAVSGIEAAIRAKMKCIGIGDPAILGNADLVLEGLHQVNILSLARFND